MTPGIPSAEGLSADLVERMVALVRGIVEHADEFRALGEPHADSDFLLAPGTTLAAREARAIAALLPKPVDPDLIEAREVAVASAQWSPEYAEQMVEGEYDFTPAVSIALAAIKRGRELAKRDPSHAA